MIAGSQTQKGTDPRERSASALIIQADPKMTTTKASSGHKDTTKKSVSIYGIKSLATTTASAQIINPSSAAQKHYINTGMISGVKQKGPQRYTMVGPKGEAAHTISHSKSHMQIVGSPTRHKDIHQSSAGFGQQKGENRNRTQSQLDHHGVISKQRTNYLATGDKKKKYSIRIDNNDDRYRPSKYV